MVKENIENIMNTRKPVQADPRFKVGSQVTFQFGQDRLKGVIIEDRGAIGAGGRRLFRIEVPFDPDPPMVTEMPAEVLQPA